MSTRDLRRLGAAAKAASGAKAPRRRTKAKFSDDLAETAVDGAALGRMARIPYGDASITIELDLAPQPKERARTFFDNKALVRAFVTANGDVRRFMASVKGGGVMRSVTPEATRRFEEAAALITQRAMVAAGLEKFVCPVTLLVEFRFEGDPATWPTAHDDGDLDNIKKSLKDALNSVAYADDRLVVRTTEIKCCAERAGISLTLKPADP